MKKTIISVVGQDTVGIIARVCAYLAESKINILDISQTIIDGYFNMMMITDTSGSEKKLNQILGELTEVGNEIGVMIYVQHEDIFTKMHRI